MSKKVISFFKSIASLCLYLFYIFPINKKKIFFISFSGDKINDNPYYIYENLKKDNYKFIWCYNSFDYSLTEKNLRYVKEYNFLYFFHILTASVIVGNDFFSPYIPFRRKQFVVETWHGGGAYKRIGGMKNGADLATQRFAKKTFRKVDCFISSSEKFTDIMSSSFYVNKDLFFNSGMPRNDIFFDKQTFSKVRMKVRKEFLINDDILFVLYVPTFRNSSCRPEFDFSIDVEMLLSVLEKRFNKRTLLFFRGHHSFIKNNKLTISKETVVDVSDYDDVQKLLCATDVLISDYSSIIWDFSFTNKPIFLYVPDIDEYTKSYGFYTPIEEWGPPFAKTNDELKSNILAFDEIQYSERVNRYRSILGCYEDGHATEKVCNLIRMHLQENR